MLPIYTFLLISTISNSYAQRSWRGFAGRPDTWQLSNNDRFKPVPVTRNDERFIPPPIFPPGITENLDFQESYMPAPPNPNWESFISQPSFRPHAIEMMPSSSGHRRRKKYLVAQSQSKPTGYLKRKGRNNRNEFLSPGSKIHTDAAWLNQQYMNSVLANEKAWFNPLYMSSEPDSQILTWFNQPYMSSVQDDVKPWFNQPYMSSMPGIQTPWLEFPYMWSVPCPQEAWSNRPYINYCKEHSQTGRQQRSEISFNGVNVFSQKENQHKSKPSKKTVQITMHGDDRPFVSIWNSNNETPGEATDIFHSVADFFYPDRDEDSFYSDVDDDDDDYDDDEDDTDPDFFYPGSYAGIPWPGMQYHWPADLGYDPYSLYQSMVQDQADLEFEDFSPFAQERRRFHRYEV